jgi:hypothetical protein
VGVYERDLAEWFGEKKIASHICSFLWL